MAFTQKLGIRHDVDQQLLFNDMLEVFNNTLEASTIREEKTIRCIRIGKERGKQSLFDMIAYLKSS